MAEGSVTVNVVVGDGLEEQIRAIVRDELFSACRSALRFEDDQAITKPLEALSLAVC